MIDKYKVGAHLSNTKVFSLLDFDKVMKLEIKRQIERWGIEKLKLYLVLLSVKEFKLLMRHQLFLIPPLLTNNFRQSRKQVVFLFLFFPSSKT